MGQANARGDYEDRRNARLNEMVEQAEVILTLRVDEAGKLVLSSLARDNPVDESSPAIGFAEYLLANWRQLAGEALALKSTALAGGDHDALSAGIVRLPNGQPANEERAPVILGANGGVITSGQDGPRIELPASVAEQQS